MANEQHAQLLELGVAAWNASRPDLPDLRGSTLEGRDLRRVNLSQADLRKANLAAANLAGADLRGADLRGADLRGADVRRAQIDGARFDDADLTGALIEPERLAAFLPSDRTGDLGPHWMGRREGGLIGAIASAGRDERERVHLGVSAPLAVDIGVPFVARLVAYPLSQAERAERLLRGARGRAEPALDVARCRWQVGTSVEVSLSAAGCHVEPPARTFEWRAEAVEAVFDVSAREPIREAVLRYEVRANGIPVADPRLEVEITPSHTAEPIAHRARPTAAEEPRAFATVAAPSTAFASYSALDRTRVLDGVSALEALGIDVFIDCLDLHPGESFQPELERALLDRDLYVLFWSHGAAASQWVAWELNTVLDHRGEQPVCLNVLDPDVPPPRRLAHLHFNSRSAWVSAYLRESPRALPSAL